MALPELLGSVTSSQLWSFGALFLVLSFIVEIASHPQYPRQIPVMGKGHGILGALYDSFRYITNYHRWVSDGYDKVSSTRPPLKDSCSHLLLNAVWKEGHGLHRAGANFSHCRGRHASRTAGMAV